MPKQIDDLSDQIVTDDGEVKAHLASSENMTIPRMELEATLDAVKLARMVREELE